MTTNAIDCNDRITAVNNESYSMSGIYGGGLDQLTVCIDIFHPRSFRLPFFTLNLPLKSLQIFQAQYPSTSQPSPPAVSDVLLPLIHVRVAATAKADNNNREIGVVGVRASSLS